MPSEVGTVTTRSLIPAAQYIRMSTERQQYSTANQADAVKEYAARGGYEIVQTYAMKARADCELKVGRRYVSSWRMYALAKQPFGPCLSMT